MEYFFVLEVPLISEQDGYVKSELNLPNLAAFGCGSGGLGGWF